MGFLGGAQAVDARSVAGARRLSGCGMQALGHTGSMVAARRLRSCGVWALGHTGSAVAVWALGHTVFSRCGTQAQYL